MRAAVLLLPIICFAQTPPEKIEDSGARFSTTVTESLFGTTKVDLGAFQGNVYYVPQTALALPDFAKLKPVGTVYAKGFNVTPRDFTEGFPGLTDRLEWFAIDYTAKFYIKAPGKYRFLITSDDGARLYIDNRLIVNNDGIHAPETQTGQVALSEGPHNIRLSYFQGPRYAIALVLGVRTPSDKKWRVFNIDEFRP